jgi:hypothetical protein
MADDAALRDLSARVARGAALLDETFRAQEIPQSWDSMVDLAYLDADNARDCVLGHIFDHSEVGMQMLGLDDAAAVQYGFELAPDEHISLWPRLTAAWTALIQSRRTAGEQPSQS